MGLRLAADRRLGMSAERLQLGSGWRGRWLRLATDWRLVLFVEAVGGGAAAGAPRCRCSAGRAAGQRLGACVGRVGGSVRLVGWFAGIASGACDADLRSLCLRRDKRAL